jgi:hypothetical protein
MNKSNQDRKRIAISEKIAFLLLLFGLSVMLFVSRSIETTPEPKIADKSFLTGEPCKAPCWYGLELDRSNESDVITKLRELPFVDAEAIRTSHVAISSFSNAVEIEYDCADPEGKICGILVLSDGSLKIISSYIRYRLPIRSVIDQLGTPDAISYSPYSPHGDGCMLDLFWLKKGIRIRRTDRNSIRLCRDLSAGKTIDPELDMMELFYLSKEALNPDRCNSGGVCFEWPGLSDK